ncbi:MAG: TIGR03915 family putative DNA repair protein [Clostridia bacterium]|nr:TIGR03915 family putative DNA repair protein [Clostridia bacterium]
MTVFVAEKSIEGLCSALFLAYTEKIFPDAVIDDYKYCGSLSDRLIYAACDRSQQARVYRAILNYGGGETIGDIKACLTSCEESALKVAFDYARLVLDKKRAVFSDLSDKRVSDFNYTVGKVYGEKHRIGGFLRFKETKNGVMYAAYSPDNDITELIMPHFLSRFSATPFVIHDVKRNKVGISDGRSFRIFKAGDAATLSFSPAEKEWEDLWKRYYKSVNIKERKNKRQQDRCLPSRYRKFMPETYD